MTIKKLEPITATGKDLSISGEITFKDQIGNYDLIEGKKAIRATISSPDTATITIYCGEDAYQWLEELHLFNKGTIPSICGMIIRKIGGAKDLLRLVGTVILPENTYVTYIDIITSQSQ